MITDKSKFWKTDVKSWCLDANAGQALLEACKALLDVVERIGPPPIQQGTLCEEQDWATSTRLTRAAIARVEGSAQ